MTSPVAVVTGATGMLALALIRRLQRENVKVYAVVRPHSARLSHLPTGEGICPVECDLADIASLPEKIGEGCDWFFHFAWDATYGAGRNDMEAQTANILAATRAAHAAKRLGCSLFLGAGSQAEYGRHEARLSPETPTHPETGYGIAKLCAGQMTRAICEAEGMRHVWCRIFSTYGPYDNPRTMVMSGIEKMLAGERPQYTPGEQQWDYLYCDDAAEAFYLAACHGRHGAVYCVGSGKTRLLKDYILAIRDAIDPSMEVGIGELPYYENQVMYLAADISSLTRDTGFVPQIPFEEGVRRTVAFARAHGKGTL